MCILFFFNGHTTKISECLLLLNLVPVVELFKHIYILGVLLTMLAFHQC